MTSKDEFPLILSPNLGCPHLWSVEELSQLGSCMTLIIAGQYGAKSRLLKSALSDKLSLRRSDPRAPLPEPIPLEIVGDPIEIRDWDALSAFSKVGDTRKLINKVLHYEVLGPATRYWMVKVKLEQAEEKTPILLKTEMLLKRDGHYLPTLYDLALRAPSTCLERVNYHAVQFVENFDKKCNFIHLTDLHLARRNDEILAEVLSAPAERSPSEINKDYVNFNDNFRKFVREANRKWEAVELDFVVITGDIVDFAYHGWETSPNESENNWKTFLDILLGNTVQTLSSNQPGIRVAVFTSTGNHDWRMRPYPPKFVSKSFGLTFEELTNYYYCSYDPLRCSKEHEQMVRDTMKELSESARLDVFKGAKPRLLTWGRKMIAFLLGRPTLLRVVGAILGASGLWAGHHPSGGGVGEPLAGIVVVALGGAAAVGAWALPWLSTLLQQWILEEIAEVIVDFPLFADAKALHPYLKNINPYFNYAFQWGKHVFIVMDSGCDVFAGQLLDGKTLKQIKRMSIEDNILAQSPDSRAFDSERTYENWSQIVWLEKMLTAIASQDELSHARTFVFLHAPPMNVSYRMGKVSRWLWASSLNGTQDTWIPEEFCNLRFGTVNHYVSQFLYLCLGLRESELTSEPSMPPLRRADMIFSGHAHRNIEFRVENQEGNHIRIYCDKYNQIFSPPDNADAPESQPDWWDQHKPFFVQTAACGLSGPDEPYPPYFRKIRLDEHGNVTTFEICNLLEGRVRFPEPDQQGCFHQWFQSGSNLFSRQFSRICKWACWILFQLSRLPQRSICWIVKRYRSIGYGIRTCRIRTWLIVVGFIVVVLAICIVFLMCPGLKDKVLGLLSAFGKELREVVGLLAALPTKLWEMIVAICK